METFDFPDIFSKSKTWEHVLILSYDLGPISFFETELLNKLKVNQNTTVIIDYKNYRKMISDNDFFSNYLGVYYNLEPIKVKSGGRFHPKFYLFLSNDKAEIYIGSANLTQSGFKMNYECLFSLFFDLDEIDDEAVDFLFQVMTFLESLFINDNNLIEQPNDLIRTTVKEIVQSEFFTRVRELQSLIVGDFERSYHFLHSIQQGFYGQIERIIGETPQKLQALSPFFDDNVDVFKKLALKCKNIDIYVPKTDSTFPKSAYSDNQKMFTNISVYTAEKKDTKQRLIHSKVYRFHTQANTYDFITSGNLTNAGFHSIDNTRNLEIGILFPGEGDFLGQADLTIELVKNFEAIITSDRDNSDDQSDDLFFHIESAFYRQGKILITFDKKFIKNAKIQEYRISLLFDGIEEDRYLIKSDEDKFFIEPSMEVEGNQLIKIQLFSNDPQYKSIPITVSRETHDPNLLPTLGISAFTDCVKIGGVKGLEKAINYAKSSGREDWLLFLLSHWNLEKILQGTGENTEPDDDDTDTSPTPPKSRNSKPPKKRMRKNIDAVLSNIDMKKNISGFLEGLSKTDDKFENFIQKYIKYAIPFIVEIGLYFKKLLEREEKKKSLSPGITYPEYTWLYNYKVFNSYVPVICKNLTGCVLTKKFNSIPYDLQFKLIANVLLWIHLNTQKTLKELRLNKAFSEFEEKANQIFAAVKGLTATEVRQEATDLFKEHNVSTKVLS